ncbi:MAG: trigger factor [Lachnospiraceae bacterium]|nr:trigger factor [Lachnospiraceae bacterium]
MKKQRIGTIILAGVMVLGMTGCGNSKANAYSKYVTLGEYKGIEYTKTVQEVTEADVQSELDYFVQNHTEEKEITDRAVEDGDTVDIDFVGTMDGEEFENGSAEGYSLTIGSNSFIDGFEEGLIGHEIGEEVSLDLTFPDPYDNDPDKAGKPVNFKVTINSITVSVTPELTDELVKENTDYDTIEAYRKSIEEELQQSNEETADQQAKQDVFNKVVENCTISGYDEEESKKLVDDEFERFKETAQSYEAYGYTYEQVLAANGFDTEDALKEGITEYIKNYLEQKMVVYCIADKEGIKVPQEDVDAKVQEYMDNNSLSSKEDVYEQLGEDYFEVALLSEKVIDFLMENAVQVDSTEETTEASDTTEEETTEASDAEDSSDEDTSEETAGEDSSEEETSGEEDTEETTEAE